MNPPAQKVLEVTHMGVAVLVLTSYDVPQAAWVVPSGPVTVMALFSVSIISTADKIIARLTIKDVDGVGGTDKHHLCRYTRITDRLESSCWRLSSSSFRHIIRK